MAGAQDDVGRHQASGDEADVVGRTDHADLERRPAFRRRAERDQRELEAVPRDQESEPDQEGGDGSDGGEHRDAAARCALRP